MNLINKYMTNFTYLTSNHMILLWGRRFSNYWLYQYWFCWFSNKHL